jgi:hypothetical protein
MSNLILEMLLGFLFLFCVLVKEQATYILLSIKNTCGTPHLSVFHKTLVLPLVKKKGKVKLSL